MSHFLPHIPLPSPFFLPIHKQNGNHTPTRPNLPSHNLPVPQRASRNHDMWSCRSLAFRSPPGLFFHFKSKADEANQVLASQHSRSRLSKTTLISSASLSTNGSTPTTAYSGSTTQPPSTPHCKTKRDQLLKKSTAPFSSQSSTISSLITSM